MKHEILPNQANHHESRDLENRVTKAIQGILGAAPDKREKRGVPLNSDSDAGGTKKTYQKRMDREELDSSGKKTGESIVTTQQQSISTRGNENFLLYEDLEGGIDSGSKRTGFGFSSSEKCHFNDSAMKNQAHLNLRLEQEYLESLSNHHKLNEGKGSLSGQAEPPREQNYLARDDYSSREEEFFQSNKKKEREFTRPMSSPEHIVLNQETEATDLLLEVLRRFADYVLALQVRRTLQELREAICECTELKFTSISRDNIRLIASKYHFLRKKFFLREVPLFLTILSRKQQLDHGMKKAANNAVKVNRACQSEALSRTSTRETQYNIEDTGKKILSVEEFKEGLNRAKMSRKKKLRSETKFIVDKEMEHEKREKLSFLAIQKEFESGMLFDKSSYIKTKVTLTGAQPYEDSEENIVENLLLAYWGIPIKGLTQRSMLIKRYMVKLKMEMTKEGDRKEDLKKRISSCLILCPLLIFEMDLDRAEQHLNTTIGVLDEDQTRKQTDSDKLYTGKEGEDLIYKCKMWLSWIYLMKMPNALIGVRLYHLKIASNYFEEAELLVKEKGPVLTKSILELFLEYNSPSISSIFNPTENTKKKCLKLIDYLPQHKCLLSIILSSINLDSGDRNLEKQAISELEGHINNKEYIFLCTAKLYKHFALSSNWKLAWKVANHARAVEAVENEYHQELIWNLWIKATARAAKADEAFFKTVIARLEQHPDNFLIFYQFSRVCVKYTKSHYTIAISTIEHLIDNLKETVDLQLRYHAMYWKGQLFKECLHHREAGRIFGEAKSGFEQLEVVTRKIEYIDSYLETLREHEEYFSEVLENISKNSREDDSFVLALWKNFRLNQSLSNLGLFDKFAYSIIELFLNRPKDSLTLQKLTEEYPSRIECWVVYWNFVYKRHKLTSRGWRFEKGPEDENQEHPYSISKIIDEHYENIKNTFGSYIGLSCGSLWQLLQKELGDIDLNETLALVKFKSLLQKNLMKAFDFIQTEVKVTNRRPNSFLYYLYCRLCVSLLGVFTKHEIDSELKKKCASLAAEKRQEYLSALNRIKYADIEKCLKELVQSEFTSQRYKAKINYYLAEGAYVTSKSKKEIMAYYKKSEEGFSELNENKFLKSDKRLVNSKVLQAL